MYSEILANRVRELKETEEGVKMMCEFADEIYREGEARGEARGEKNGIEKKQREVSMSLARKGMQVSEIAQVVEAEEKLVRSWLAEAETAGR